MPRTEEQERRGQIIARRRMRLGLTQIQLAAETGVKLRTIQNVEAGDTWRQGTVDKIMERLGMSDDDFDGGSHPEPDDESRRLGRELADSRVWSVFPDDVQVTLLVVGKWLEHYPPSRRFDEIGRLTDYMRARETPGS